MVGLTAAQARCLEAIRRLTVNGVPPSLEELRLDLGLATVSGVHRFLRLLRERGVVDWSPMRARTLHIVADAVSEAALDRLSDAELKNVAITAWSICLHRGIAL